MSGALPPKLYLDLNVMSLFDTASKGTLNPHGMVAAGLHNNFLTTKDLPYCTFKEI